MPECARCGGFTDNPSSGEYYYCDECLRNFAEVEESGVIVDRRGDDYHILVTDSDASIDGGVEHTQVEAIARGKHIADECGVDGVFKYEKTGSRWLLDEYLQEHPEIRQDVHARLRRVPDRNSRSPLDKLKEIFER